MVKYLKIIKSKTLAKKVLAIFLLLIFFIIPFVPVQAQEGKVLADVAVSGNVLTNVSVSHSTLNISPTQTLADPANHLIVVTMTLRDNLDNLLPNLNVAISSNRGAIDLMRVLSGPDAGVTGSGNIAGRSDAAGVVSFSIGSYVPGEATLTIIADSVANFGTHKITFLPLPFPAQVTVSIPIPFTHKKITVIAPKEEITPQMQEAKKLANIGTEISIPFWSVSLLVIFIILGPILLIFTLIYLRRIRRFEAAENNMLARIATHNDINALRQEIQNNGLDRRGIINNQK